MVIGAEDPGFFSNDVGTLYLDFVGATLARSTSRILRATNVSSVNQDARKSAT